jgi:hypothetical protein
MFGIRDPEKIHSGSQIFGAKKHRIPDPVPQHCLGHPTNHLHAVIDITEGTGTNECKQPANLKNVPYQYTIAGHRHL